MSRKKYPIKLIPLSYVSGTDEDSVTEGHPREVLADRKSVTRSEFYPAFANGLRPEVAFTVWEMEYNSEPRLSYNQTEYEIIRTYVGKDEREIELVCQPLALVETGLSRLRDTIEIWHMTFTKNSMGAEKQTPVRLYTLPAQIKYVSGNAPDSDEIIEHRNTAEITIKYKEEITEDMFIMLGDKRWDITNINNPYNRNETLVIKAERRVVGDA